LAATPVSGPRVYRTLTPREERSVLSCPAWSPDWELWGDDPREILREFRGIDWNGGKSEGELAGHGNEADTCPSSWEPGEKDGLPPAAQFYRTSGENMPIDHPDAKNYRDVWNVLTETKPTSVTRSDRELIMNYHRASKRPLITCFYCGSQMRSKDLQKLLKWWRCHECVPAKTQ
jgi:hypothetical protein